MSSEFSPCAESSVHHNKTWMSCEQSQRACSCPNHLAIPANQVIAPHAALTLASDPTFDHLTATNDVPTCIEELSALERISSLKAHRLSLATYTKKLEALQANAIMQAECIEGELQRVSAARLLIDGALKVREAVLSPARRLPPNVLAIIFEHSIEFPMKCDCYPSDCRHKYNALWSLELVCRRWRDVVIHSSHLWSFIGVDLSLCSRPGYMRMLAKQIVRAGLATAVSVSIYSSSIMDYESLMHYDGTISIEVAAILLPLAPRMQEIDLRVSPQSADALNLWSNSLYSLKRLYICRNSPSNWHNRQRIYRQKCHAFESAPKLVYLETDQSTFSTQDPFLLPPNQILRYSNNRYLCQDAVCGRAYCWECSSSAMVLSTLSDPTFKNLKECRAFLSVPSELVLFQGLEMPVVSGILSLTLLTRATGQDALAIEQFLDSVYLPELKELTIDLSPFSKKRLEMNLFTCICDALERAQPPLASFCFKQGVVPPDELVRLFRVAPGLRELRLENIADGLTDATIAELTVCKDKRVLAPELHTLRVSGDLGFDVGVFATMVESRSRVAPFAEIDLCWHVDEFGEEEEEEEKEKERSVLLERLEPLSALGLKVTTCLKMV